MTEPFLLNFTPGIQRDGTRFDTTRYLDALWCRWRAGRPRKMGGYKQITGTLNGLPRRIHSFYTNGNIISHIGTVNGIQQVIYDKYGNFISASDRTPSNFIGGTNTGWTIDAIYDTTSAVVQLVSHAVPDVGSVSSSLKTTPYIGQIDSTTPLVSMGNPGTIPSGTWTQVSVAGGVVCIQPFVFAFDAAGLIQWSAANLALYLGVSGGSTGAGQARVSANKIVQGMPLRGGGAQQPAAIFWSTAEVIIASYVGTPAWFAFSTVSPSSSILSSDCIVEYDGLYFWSGVDRFLVFNGTVNEVPNAYNADWFFDNLTPGYEAQTFAFKVPRYGEIWWCACMFGATVPNYAVIYNVRENCWYDTKLPDGGRSAGYFAQGSRFPVMTDVVAGSGGYGLWMHETGTDKVINGVPTAVRSYYETGWFGGPMNDPPNDAGLNFHQMEPDFVQSGDMSAFLVGRANANAPRVEGPPCPILQAPTVPQEQLVSFTPTMPTRYLRMHIESNVIGGNYIAGRNIGRAEPGSKRLTT